MSIPLYFDHHVPAAVTAALRRRKIDVLTAFDDGAAAWDDHRILERAGEIGRPVVTMDEDFLKLADQAWVSGKEFFGVIYVSDAHLPVGQIVTDLQLIAEAMTVEELASRIVFVPL